MLAPVIAKRPAARRRPDRRHETRHKLPAIREVNIVGAARDAHKRNSVVLTLKGSRAMDHEIGVFREAGTVDIEGCSLDRSTASRVTLDD